VYGKIKIIEGEAVIESLKKLVDKYEEKLTKSYSVKIYLKKKMQSPWNCSL
jgi:transcriptional regulator